MRTMRGHTCLLLRLRYQYPLVLKMMPFAVLLANENGRHVQGFMGQLQLLLGHAESCLNLFCSSRKQRG